MLGPALRMIVSLAIVLALMYLAARLLARSKGVSAGPPRALRRARPSLLSAVSGSRQVQKPGRRPARQGSSLELVARQPLGKTASLSLVRVADKLLLIGVTDSAVQLLSELGAVEREDEPADPVSVASADIAERADSRTVVSVLDQLRERTVRRA